MFFMWRSNFKALTSYSPLAFLKRSWSAPNHYQNQCWNIVIWTLRCKLQWNFKRNSNNFIQGYLFEIIVWKMVANFVSSTVWNISSGTRNWGHYKFPCSFLKRVWAVKSKSSSIWTLYKNSTLHAWVRYFVLNFKSTLWNSAQNVLSIHRKIYLQVKILELQNNAPPPLPPITFVFIVKGLIVSFVLLDIFLISNIFFKQVSD